MMVNPDAVRAQVEGSILQTISRTLFPKGLPTLGEHLLLVPLTLFTMAPTSGGPSLFSERLLMREERDKSIGSPMR